MFSLDLHEQGTVPCADAFTCLMYMILNLQEQEQEAVSVLIFTSPSVHEYHIYPTLFEQENVRMLPLRLLCIYTLV